MLILGNTPILQGSCTTVLDFKSSKTATIQNRSKLIGLGSEPDLVIEV